MSFKTKVCYLDVKNTTAYQLNLEKTLKADNPSSSRANYPEDELNFETEEEQQEKDPKKREVTSDSEIVSIIKDDVTIEDYITPDNTPSIEYGSGLIQSLCGNPDELCHRLRLILQKNIVEMIQIDLMMELWL